MVLYIVHVQYLTCTVTGMYSTWRVQYLAGTVAPESCCRSFTWVFADRFWWGCYNPPAMYVIRQRVNPFKNNAKSWPIYQELGAYLEPAHQVQSGLCKCGKPPVIHQLKMSIFTSCTFLLGSIPFSTYYQSYISTVPIFLITSNLMTRSRKLVNSPHIVKRMDRAMVCLVCIFYFPTKNSPTYHPSLRLG